MRLRLGIVGNGFVGKATQGFASDNVEMLLYDIDPDKCSPKETTLRDIAFCDLVMIAVPTPMEADGSCSTRIVKKVIEGLKQFSTHCTIIVRSTVPIGFCEENGVDFMPEFLTEANWPEDFRNNPLWIIGTDFLTESKENALRTLLSGAKKRGSIVSDTFKVISTKEAEAIKYFRNCFLAMKVGFCNEFYDLCHHAGIDYVSMISLAAHQDNRIGGGHTLVPGPDGLRGFGGTCFPKDLSSLLCQFKERHVPCPILESVQHRNLTIDRPERDWTSLEGRAVVSTESKDL